MSKARGFLQEFQEFAVKGNMIDLAVGVIIGAAFSKIIDSLVKDVIMPVISFILGGQVDFANQFWVLRAPANYTGPRTYDALAEAGAVILAWGNFVTILINFILLAFVVFCLVKAINSARKRVIREEAAIPPAPAEEVVLLREIRDSLKR
ncbi:large conductance mechanosensitive channel protein MscL [Pollutimonas nitritireducens]|uniref:Large-conductance mechanosensitive channel n=1 Tax=Pollutimonas nitritireducens TaxID=2045209 RepID=A0A2N4UKL6_9BURK|nr:large conductance mechanosensitive channel protein MscL [Pollutimonas nitritireducens]PLC55577.1 large conductance mechanosensitive channel protein MscL [Pollutimonas nitritireducens]